MTSQNTVTVSVVEYDIESISSIVPGRVSHVGISFSGALNAEINFGSFLNGAYQPVGMPFDPRDTVGAVFSGLALPSRIAASMTYDEALGRALYDAVVEFARDLRAAGINYEAIPNENAIQANSNTAAAFALAILGFDVRNMNFSGSPIGFKVDLSATKFGLKPPAYYVQQAYLNFVETMLENGIPVPTPAPRDECFLAGTPVDMWDGSQKPIEQIRPDDMVVSYDRDGNLVPGRVARTFENRARHILDVHGLMMTPGHVTYCAGVDGEENPFAGRHVPILDILRSDGAVMKKDGTLVRAATGYPVGSDEDRIIPAIVVEDPANGGGKVMERKPAHISNFFSAGAISAAWLYPSRNLDSVQTVMSYQAPHGVAPGYRDDLHFTCNCTSQHQNLRTSNDFKERCGRRGRYHMEKR